MLELNKVMLVGNLTRDPELSYVPSGSALAKIGMALNRRYKGKDGEQKEETTFVDIESWGKTAEFCGKYLKKGRRVFIEGRLKFDQWEARDGVKRSKLSVVAERVEFVDARPHEGGSEGVSFRRPEPAATKPTPAPKAVATPVGGVPEVVAHERTGMLGATVDELAFGLAALLENPAEGLVAMGRRARLRVAERHGAAALADRLEALYRAVCEERRCAS